MQKIAFVFTCLACATHGRRVQSPAEQVQHVVSAEDLATLLLALDSTGAFFGQMPSLPGQASTPKLSQGPLRRPPRAHFQASKRAERKTRKVDANNFGDVGAWFDFLATGSKAENHDVPLGGSSRRGMFGFPAERGKAEVHDARAVSRRGMLDLVGAGIVGAAVAHGFGPFSELEETKDKLKEVETKLNWKNGLAAFLGLLATGEAVGLTELSENQTALTAELEAKDALEAELKSQLREVQQRQDDLAGSALDAKYRAKAARAQAVAAADDLRQQMNIATAKEEMMHKAIQEASAELHWSRCTQEAAEMSKQIALEEAEARAKKAEAAAAAAAADKKIAVEEAAAKAAREAKEETLNAEAAKAAEVLGKVKLTVEGVKNKAKQRLEEANKALEAAAAIAAADKKLAVEEVTAAKEVALQEAADAAQIAVEEAAAKAAEEAKEETLKAEAVKAAKVFEKVKWTVEEVRKQTLEKAEAEKEAALKEAEEAATAKVSAALEKVAEAEAELYHKKAMLNKQIFKADEERQLAIQNLATEKRTWAQEREKMEEERTTITKAEVSAAVQKSAAELKQASLDRKADNAAALQRFRQVQDMAANTVAAAEKRVAEAEAALANKEAALQSEIDAANEAKQLALQEVENQKQMWAQEREEMQLEHARKAEGQVAEAEAAFYHKEAKLKREIVEADDARQLALHELATEKHMWAQEREKMQEATQKSEPEAKESILKKAEAEKAAALKLVAAAEAALTDRESSLKKEIDAANEAKQLALQEVENQEKKWALERERMTDETNKIAKELTLLKIKRSTAGSKGFEVKAKKSEKKIKVVKKMKVSTR